MMLRQVTSHILSLISGQISRKCSMQCIHRFLKKKIIIALSVNECELI